ncbi:hypothetical protein PIIN_11324 [Serendipita indica DSM 11827]|uniref:Uncharacterized protein n=1 Tax=Serendipita indica (strain DSM 11827) TaxID=1109443 RepID=G4U1A4_SERID|nr:hypothetical protein PIIN_11324 [Serendipita indica DSM 11827]
MSKRTYFESSDLVSDLIVVLPPKPSLDHIRRGSTSAFRRVVLDV